jgi:hypothetical protein
MLLAMKAKGGLILALLLLPACHPGVPPAAGPRLASASELRDCVARLCRGESVAATLAPATELSAAAVATLEREWTTARAVYGACASVTAGERRGARHGATQLLLLRMARADLPLALELDERGAVSRVGWESPQPTEDSLEHVVADIAALGGESSLLVADLDRGVQRAAHNIDARLAVASAFKLSILRTLLDDIAAGRAAWDEVVKLSEADRSLPAGILQDWPAATPITIKTAALLMMSMSDNTATNVLIRRLGRARIESAVGYGRPPLLTTAEMFKLRDKTSSALAREYLGTSGSERQRLLGRVAGIDLATLDADTDPALVGDIEWFFSVRELCGFIGSMRGLDVIALATGAARRPDWRYVAYKGGTENAVAQFTYLIERQEDGRAFCVSGTWNEGKGGIDHKLFARFGERVLGLVHALPAEPTPGSPPLASEADR